MLAWERHQIGLSIAEVADKLNMTRVEVASWEDGDALPSLLDLELLADLYLCPVGHFFLDSPPMGGIAALDFRGLDKSKADSLSYEPRRRLRQFLRLVELATSWLRQMGQPWDVSLPAIQLDASITSVAATAVRALGIDWDVRSNWTSSEEAFAGWRDAVERQRIFVFSLTLPAGQVRGASVWQPEGPPAILVNHSDIEYATGRLFTLLHEYAHLLLRRSGLVCDFRGQPEAAAVETFANRFAAEAIVPTSAFRDRLAATNLEGYRDWWTERQLDTLREPFHASRDTVAIILETLRLAPAEYYRNRRAAWDRRRVFGRGGPGSRQTKPQRRYRELGAAMSTLLVSAAGQESISKLDIAEALDMRLARLPDFVTAARVQQH